MKKIVLIFLALTMSITSIKAQLTQIQGNDRGLISHGSFFIRSSEVPILGSPYVNDIYKEGETIINGKTKTKALMRYNALTEAVELLDQNSQKPRKLLRRKNIAASFDGKTYTVMEYEAENKIKLGYFNQLNTGKVVLLYRPKKKFVQAENPDNGYDVYDPPTYKDDSEYYIKTGEKAAVSIKLNKRKILKAIGDKGAVLKPFIKKHHLDLSKESDVILLLNYYNNLEDKKGVGFNAVQTGIAS